MWAMALTELPPEVLQARLPVRYDDNRKFNDKFQAMPERGYIGLFENLLYHPAISVTLSCALQANGAGLSPYI